MTLFIPFLVRLFPSNQTPSFPITFFSIVLFPSSSVLPCMLSGCAQVSEIRIDTLPDLSLYGCKVCRRTGSKGTVGTVGSVGSVGMKPTVSTATSNVSGPTLRSQWTIVSFCHRFFLLVVPFWYFFLVHLSCSCWLFSFNYLLSVGCLLFAVVSSFRNLKFRN